MKYFLESNRKILYIFIIAADGILLLSSDIFSFFIILGLDFYRTYNFSDYRRIFLYVIALKILCLYVFHLYTKIKYKSDFITTIYIFKAITASSLIMAVMAYFFRADSIPRPVILISWLNSTLLIMAWRILAKRFIEMAFDRDFFKSRLLIVGVDKASEKIAMRLLNDASINYKLIGFVRCTGEDLKEDLLGFPVLGSIDNIAKVLAKYRVDEVVLTSQCLTHKDITAILPAFKKTREAIIRITQDLYDGIISRSRLSEEGVSFVPMTVFYGVPIWYPPLKKIMNYLIAAFLLVISSPILLIISLAIKVTSRGPVFYITKRVGYMYKIFIMYKFRTMYKWSSHDRIERWAKKIDARITPVGRFLRRFRMDELPQLVNVLKGDMSVIGPRPESRYYVNRLLKELPLYSERLKIKPGITGWAQVNFGYARSMKESKEKLLYDIYYIQNQSLALDTLIILKTIKTVLLGTGAR